MVDRSRSERSSPDRALVTPAAASVRVEGPDGWDLRRGSRQLTRFIADGTGRTDGEIKALIVVGAVPVLVAGAVAASRGAVRLIDFIADA